MARKRYNEEDILRLMGGIEAHLEGRFGPGLDDAILGHYRAECFGSLTSGANPFIGYLQGGWRARFGRLSQESVYLRCFSLAPYSGLSEI